MPSIFIKPFDGFIESTESYDFNFFIDWLNREFFELFEDLLNDPDLFAVYFKLDLFSDFICFHSPKKCNYLRKLDIFKIRMQYLIFSGNHWANL